jgi:hypothetical protein
MRTVFSLGDDEGRRNRAVLAIAGAIAVHEIILGVIAAFGLFKEPSPPPDKVVSEVVTIVRRTPPPTPVATPKITPPPFVAVTHKKLNQARPLAAALPAVRRGGAAARNQHLIVAPRPPVVVLVTPVPEHVALTATTSLQNGAAAGQANGGTGKGAGAGDGNGGAGGTGSGSGGSGARSGVDTPVSPCGGPWFDFVRRIANPDGSVYVQLNMRVELRDGKEVIDPLHWYFYYRTASDDPFTPAHEHEKVRLQFPPQGYDLEGNQKAAIVLAIQHTRPNGTTDLPDCPETPVQG